MTGSRTVSLVIADDHVMVLEAMRLLLASAPNIDVVGAARDGDALLALIEAHSPDIALVDLSMPGPNAQAIAKTARQQAPQCRLIALTMHLEPYLARSLLDAGYAGYVIKDAAVQDLLEAIAAVMSGQTYLSQAVADRGARQAEDQAALTPRELECLRAAAEGLPNKVIAVQLNVSLRTVKYHLENVFRKLGARNRSEAIAVGRKRGMY